MRTDEVSLDFLVLTLTQVMFHRAEWALTVSVSLMDLSHLFNISAGHNQESESTHPHCRCEEGNLTDNMMSAKS